MRFFQYVTFQSPTEDRTATGQVTYTYENVDDLIDVPARITALTTETRGERMTIVEDLFNIIVAGEREITPEMAVLDGEAVYDVKRVVPYPLGRRGRRTTGIIAERVAL